MKPYYEHAGIQLFLGDCREIIPTLPKPTVIIMDPPYGYDYSSGRARWSGIFDGGVYADADGSIEGDSDTTLRDWVLKFYEGTPSVVFGNLRSIVPNSRGVLVWDKGDAAGMGDLEFPWKPNWELIFISGQGFQGARTSGVLRAPNISRVSMGRCHPNEKPIALMRQLLEKCPAGLVIDPFCGSGPVLLAAKDLGRNAIGIEICEEYCSTAARRLSQEVLALGR